MAIVVAVDHVVVASVSISGIDAGTLMAMLFLAALTSACATVVPIALEIDALSVVVAVFCTCIARIARVAVVGAGAIDTFLVVFTRRVAVTAVCIARAYVHTGVVADLLIALIADVVTRWIRVLVIWRQIGDAISACIVTFSRSGSFFACTQDQTRAQHTQDHGA